ncbi:MAG: hypothetical protein IPN72_16325 [Saprospiraceae bacterium]|nr:hypothetical protein [Saprospiraceae bacterium]
MAGENIGKYNILLEFLTSTNGVDKVKKETTGLENVFGRAKAAFAGIVAGQSLISAGKAIFDVTKKYESYAKILEVALGSQKESKKSLDLIQETAKETVFSVDELTASYIKFANRGVKLTREEIISYADLAASQGKSFEQLTEAVLDAGTAEFERLKEFGIRASKNGDVVRLAFRGINKEVKNTPEAINAAILSFGKLDGVAGSNQEQMSTLSGMVSNLGDGFENLLKIVGEKLAPFFEGFTYLLSGTVGVISELISPTKSLSEKTSELSAQFNSEINVLLKLNPENANRARLIADINSKYGDYLPSLITERTTTEELYKFQYLANQEFKKKIFYQAYQEELNKELQKTKKATQEIADIELKRVRTQQGAPRLKQVFGSVAADQIIDKGLKEEDDRAIKSNEVIIDNYDKRVAEVETVYSKLVAKLGVTLQDLEAQFGAVVAAPVIDTTTNNISGVVKRRSKQIWKS